ncbi:MAG: hypothetical protein FJX75_21090 [Armatimonadetes bacterium]|nr:hypothetical protein [Armatimonadota bacterium]
MQSRILPFLAAPLVAASAAAWWLAWHPPKETDAAASATPTPTEVLPRVSFEEWARQEFARRYPNERPLNWAIAEKAEEFRRTEPMGAFVLGRNDCSDFTDAVLDDALGAQARFRRNSDQHLLASEPSVWEFYRWEPGATLLPGDEIAVRHSPHYAPSEDAPWHRGIVGTDGLVYDWTKLKAWGTDRYGRHEPAWFMHSSLGPGEAIVRRLRAVYRYMIEPIPLHGVPSPAAQGEP